MKFIQHQQHSLRTTGYLKRIGVQMSKVILKFTEKILEYIRKIDYENQKVSKLVNMTKQTLL